MVLVQLAGGAVCVRALNRGGAADASGLVARGDVLVAVDGLGVAGWGLNRVRELVVGAEGAPVTLRLARMGNLARGRRLFEVTLVRSPVGG